MSKANGNSKVSDNVAAEADGGISHAAPAMTPFQKELCASSSISQFGKYRNLMVGNGSWATLALYEAINLLLLNLPGVLGIAGRRFFLRKFFASCGGGLIVGRGVLFRNPGGMDFGNGVVVDDNSVIEARISEECGSSSLVSLGDGVVIGRNSILVAKGKPIRLGRACNIGSYCRIATEGGIEIGESTLVGAYSYIGPGNHRFDDPTRAIMEQGMEDAKGVRIGANSWIGTRATMLDGVRVGDGAIVGAHSLVMEDVPSGSVVAGCPAKVIHDRK